MSANPQALESGTARRSGVVARIAGGVVAGIIVAIGFGTATLVGAALNGGMVLGVDGLARPVVSSAPALAPGAFVAVTAALLYAARELWWAPLLGRMAAGVIVFVVIVAGNLQFDHEYFRSIGVLPWWEMVVRAASQSMLSYAFLGVVIASLATVALSARARSCRTVIDE